MITKKTLLLDFELRYKMYLYYIVNKNQYCTLFYLISYVLCAMMSCLMDNGFDSSKPYSMPTGGLQALVLGRF